MVASRALRRRCRRKRQDRRIVQLFVVSANGRQLVRCVGLGRPFISSRTVRSRFFSRSVEAEKGSTITLTAEQFGLPGQFWQL